MGIEDRNELIVSTIGGKTFKSCRQCAAHLLWTITQLKKRYPNATLRVIQPSFNTSVKKSAGTHDFCSCLDVEIIGLDWSTTQKFLRSCGWAAWWRTLAQGFSNHIHMISITCKQKKGVFVDGGLSQFGRLTTSSQIADYYQHTFGLKNMHNIDMDKSWFPGDEGDPPWPIGTPAFWEQEINKTLFDYDDWLEEQMTPAQIEELAKQVKEKVMNEVITLDDGTDVSVRQCLKRAAETPDIVRTVGEVVEKVKANLATANSKLTAIKNKLGA